MSPQGVGASWRSSIGERTLAILLLIPAIVLAIMFWRAQAMDPLTLPGLLLDRFLQLATILWIPGLLICVVSRPRAALSAIVFVASTGLALSASVLIAGLVRPPADAPTCALAAASAASCGGAMWRFAPRFPGYGNAWLKVAAGVLAATIPILEFWHGAAFIPSQTEVALQQRIATSFGPDRQGALNLTISNQTKAQVLVLASRLDICYWKRSATIVYPPDGSELECQAHRPVSARSWVSAESALPWQKALNAPPGADMVSVRARIAFARGDRLRLSTTSDRSERLGTCVAIETVPVLDESRVKALAQQDKFLTYADRDDDGGLNYFLHAGPLATCTPEGANTEHPDDPQGLSRYYGVTEQTVIYEAPITQEQESPSKPG